jgi:hypothetical protein
MVFFNHLYLVPIYLVFLGALIWFTIWAFRRFRP